MILIGVFSLGFRMIRFLRSGSRCAPAQVIFHQPSLFGFFVLLQCRTSTNDGEAVCCEERLSTKRPNNQEVKSQLSSTANHPSFVLDSFSMKFHPSSCIKTIFVCCCLVFCQYIHVVHGFFLNKHQAQGSHGEVLLRTTTTRNVAFRQNEIRNSRRSIFSYVNGRRIGVHQQVQKQSSCEENESPSTTTYLIFPGGGIFMNWQGGVITYLREHGYDLSQCTFIGSSAGSMTATLAAVGVDMNGATSLALELATKYQVWDRPQGLQGILNAMIAEWLDTLVPSTSDLDPSSISNISILVTPVPFLWKKQSLTSFENRQDLIDSNLASIYLPFFSDGGLWHNIRDKPYIDGNFLSTGKHYRPIGAKRRNTIVLNWQKDPAFADKGEEDLVKTITPQAVWDIVEQGKQYAKMLEERGRFQNIPKL